MPPKNAKKPAKSGATSEESSSKKEKETKGGTSVKVRHILCEKQARIFL